MIDIDNDLEIAKDAALLAGKFLISANNDAQKILGDDGRDIKLQIDQDAENLSLNIFPKDQICQFLEKNLAIKVILDQIFG